MASKMEETKRKIIKVEPEDSTSSPPSSPIAKMAKIVKEEPGEETRTTQTDFITDVLRLENDLPRPNSPASDPALPLRYPSRPWDRAQFRCQRCGKYYFTMRRRDLHQESCTATKTYRGRPTKRERMRKKRREEEEAMKRELEEMKNVDVEREDWGYFNYKR